ncbi:MAG: VOC family protein [Caulobacteraceae bacterium]
MARVVGLDGVFLKAPDLDAWRAWYRDVLGVRFEDFEAALFKHPDTGFTNLAAFPPGTDYFRPTTQPFMINLIVEDIDGLLAMAKAPDAKPVSRQDEEYGRFAWLIDPAGVKVELWEPRGAPPV